MTFLSGCGVIGGAKYQSLDFDVGGGSNYLTIPWDDWGAVAIANGDAYGFDLTKFAIIGTTNGSGVLYAKTAPSFQFKVDISEHSQISIGQNPATGSTANFICDDALMIDGLSWNAFMFHVDTANADPAERLKCWRNGILQASSGSNYLAPTMPVLVGVSDIVVGAMSQHTQKVAFINGYLPSPSEVFDGTAGKLKNVATIQGAASVLDVKHGVVTHDRIVPTAWTKVGTVLASEDAP